MAVLQLRKAIEKWSLKYVTIVWELYKFLSVTGGSKNSGFNVTLFMDSLT